MGAQVGAAVSRGVQCADGCGAAWAAGALGEGAWDVAECGDGARGGGAFDQSDGDGLRSVSFFMLCGCGDERFGALVSAFLWACGISCGEKGGIKEYHG